MVPLAIYSPTSVTKVNKNMVPLVPWWFHYVKYQNGLDRFPFFWSSRKLVRKPSYRSLTPSIPRGRVAAVGIPSARAKMAIKFSSTVYLLFSRQMCCNNTLVFACNCNFAKLTQSAIYYILYIPCNSALLSQETLF